MGQLIRLDEQAKYVQSIFANNMTALSRSVPRSLGDPERLIRIAYNSIAYDPAVLKVCETPRGMGIVLGCVMEALKLGLTIGGPAQESWIIPFKEKGEPSAQLIIGYQGYRNILDRSKAVLDLHPRAVYANDQFDVEFGSKPRVTHKPYYLLGKTEPGALVAVYAVAHLRGGGIQVEVMPKAEVDEHRSKSKARDSGPWVNFYEAMALKTVIRKIAKYLPKSSEILVRALDLDERADLGMQQVIDAEGWTIAPMIGGAAQVGHSGLAALKESMKADKAPNGAPPAKEPARPAPPPTRPAPPPPAPPPPARPPLAPVPEPDPDPELVEDQEDLAPWEDERPPLENEPAPPSTAVMPSVGELFGPPKSTSEADARRIVEELRRANTKLHRRRGQ